MADFGIELRLPAAEPVVRVGIVGAGVAGLVTAKVLTAGGPRRRRLRPDARRRRRVERDPPLPGAVDAEPEGDTYTLSDFPMPADYPEWPTGEQVQAYLAAYAAHTGVDRRCAWRPR